jgi:glycosyltransferase involved in cell wall biosynthesis
MEKLILQELSKRILFLGVSMKTKGGMTAVLVSYDKYIENMQFIPTWKLGNKLIKSGYALQAITRMWLKCIFDRNIKIIHIHGAANASFYRCKIFINLAKKLKKKVILHEHAADFVEFYQNSNDKTNINQTLNKCDCLIVLSESWKEYFSSIGVDKNKIYVLNNIVSPPNFKDVPRKDNKLHLMFMGEISIRKGGFDLLQAISDNKEYFKDKLLLRMGGNEVDGDIQTFIKQHQLEEFVSYEGWISGNKKTECLNWEDVYILPSYNEGLPIAILEAMSYKHPIISTPVGGIPEIIKTQENGILVHPGNKKEIAEAIKYYIEHPENIKIHGEKAYQTVQDFFPQKVFTDLTHIYQSLLQ